jgi:hypothetical protein
MVTVVNTGMLNGYSCKSVKIIDLRGVKACVLLKFTDFFNGQITSRSRKKSKLRHRTLSHPKDGSFQNHTFGFVKSRVKFE